MATFAPPAPFRQQGDKPTPRDFRQEVTDSIVQMLEKGVAPWQKPWESGASSLSVPFNRKSQSNRIYAGSFAGAELETCWRQESIAGTETVRKRIS